MADRFTNLPGFPVTLVESGAGREVAPAGPTVAVVGSASKGVSETPSVVLSPTAALSRFGSSGSLGRGLVEAFQGGASSAVGLRLFSTKGMLDHVGDIAGTAGITIEPVLAGSDALSNYSAIYNQQTDQLRVYEVASGTKVYDKTGDVVAVNLGLVTVTGEAENDVLTTPQVFGSIGKHLVVADDETAQVAAIDVGTHRIFTFGAGIAGINLGKLRFIDADTTPIMLQIRSSDDTVLIEELISAVDVASRTATIAAAVDASYYTEGVGGDGVAAVIDGLTQPHAIRFISLTEAIALSEVNDSRLPTVGVGVLTPEVLETPGSNFNGLPLLVNSAGVRVDEDLAEVEPHKMNLYEGLLEAARLLESADIDELVFMDVYADDVALDGQTSGASKLPTTEAEGLLFDSAVNASAGIDALACTTISGKANRFRLDAADGTERDLAASKLEAAGRGNCWVVFSTAKGATFGEFRESDEIVRAARILNWETFDADELVLHLDRDVGFSFVDADGVVEAGLQPAFKVYYTDQLFYYRVQEVAGELVHFWYTAKSDPEGNVYNEVNFAYRLAAICHDLTENEVGVLGVIGVNPPTNHFNPAAISTWVGQLPEYSEDGNVSRNGSGLLGNKFLAGYGLNGLYTNINQFDPGFLATEDDQLDDEDLVQDSNGYNVDLGKYLSIVGSWPFMTNAANSGVAYIASGAALYAGVMSRLAPWRGTTAKRIGGAGIRLPMRLPKRNLNDLVGLRYVMFTEDSSGAVTVVDGPTAALPNSDYTRNMTMRLCFDVISRLRDAARPFLGESTSAIAKSGLETRLKKELSDVQRGSEGALESYSLETTQTALDRRLGTAHVSLSLRVIGELRRLSFSLALTL